MQDEFEDTKEVVRIHKSKKVAFDDEIHKSWWGLALYDLMFHRF
jgi:hypothetical protein